MSSPLSSQAEVSSDLLAHRLAALRAELDRIDDALHDGLMRRAEIVTQVGALGAKGRVPLRPGREASIMRRLLARNHGALAPATLVRIWREMLAGSSAQQTPMTIAVADAALLPLAHEHFGALALVEQATAAQVIEDVRVGVTTVGVLPVPSGRERWWRTLLDRRLLDQGLLDQGSLDGGSLDRGLLDQNGGPRVHVVARLPFWARAGTREAVIVTSAPPDPSGHDRTLVGGVAPLQDLGLEVVAMIESEGAWLAEVAGFIDETTLAGFGLPHQAFVLGAYAIPVGDFA